MELETEVIHVPADVSDEMLKRIAWETLFSSCRFTFEEENLEERLRHFQRGAHAVLADVRDMGKRIIGNIVRNLPLLAQARPIFPFAQAFTGVPAVICGAGPSLEKSLPFLPDIRQRALIFAGGSALNALTHASIFPHFAAALDPEPPPHLFRQQGAVEAPLLYQNRVANQLLQDCHGPRIWVPDNVSYPIEQWLVERLGIDAPPFEAGWNVATFCLHVAVAMGCNPIVITGVDLCNPKGKAYAAGVSMPNAPKEELKDDFLLAAEWIEEFVAAHPGTTFINASTGGLPLRGMRQAALQEIEFPSLTFGLATDLEGKIYSLLSGPTVASPQTIKNALQEFKENLVTSRLLIERMVALLQKWYPEDASSKGEFILPEVELEENPVHTYVLQPLWNVWQWVVCPPYKNDAYTQRLQKLLFFQKAIQEIQW